MVHEKGFTLLEVMLVMVILATTALGVTAMQSDRLSSAGKLRQHVDTFRQTVEYATDLTLLEKRAAALQLSEEGWLLHLPEKNARGGWRWKAVPKHDSLALHGEWEGPVRPELTPSTKDATPQIVILPDGQITPFSQLFRDENGEKILRVQCFGSLPLDITQLKEAG